jgi:tetratricopeptide (TPR) repeat protein
MQRKTIPFVFFAFLILLACHEDFLDETPRTFLSPEVSYKTDAGLAAGAVGLYDEMSFFLALDRGSVYVMYHLGVDESMGGHQYDVVYDHYDASLNSLDKYLPIAWDHYYRLVNNATVVYDRSRVHDWQNAELGKHIMAEALFFRAYANFHLVNVWGPVPLIREEIKEVRLDFRRDPVEDIYGLILQDLTTAENLIDYTETEPGRITKGAIQHFLSYVYLTLGDWDNALSYADKVISEGPYALMTERFGKYLDEPGNAFTDLFMIENTNREDGNTESIWVLQEEDETEFPFTSSAQHQLHQRHNYTRRLWVSPYWRLPGMKVSREYGGRGFNRCTATDYFLGLFEPGDIRGQELALRRTWLYNDSTTLPPGKNFGDTVVYDISKPPVRPCVTKFDYYDEADPEGIWSDKDVYMFRLAETYLIKAEALYRKNLLEQAADAINIVRVRAGATMISGADVDIDFILDERSRELFGEVPRRIDLTRTGKLIERVRLYNPHGGPNIQEHHVLLPIPQHAIDRNSGYKLEQNSGY